MSNARRPRLLHRQPWATTDRANNRVLVTLRPRGLCKPGKNVIQNTKMLPGPIVGALADVELLPHGPAQPAHIFASKGRRVELEMPSPLPLDSAIRIQVAKTTYLAEVYFCRPERYGFVILADVQHAFSDQDLPTAWLDRAKAATP